MNWLKGRGSKRLDVGEQIANQPLEKPYKSVWHELYVHGTTYFSDQRHRIVLNARLTEIDLSEQLAHVVAGRGDAPDFDRALGGVRMHGIADAGPMMIPLYHPMPIEVRTTDWTWPARNAPADASGSFDCGGTPFGLLLSLWSKELPRLDQRLVETFALAKLFGNASIRLSLLLDFGPLFDNCPPSTWNEDGPPRPDIVNQKLWVHRYSFHTDKMSLTTK